MLFQQTAAPTGWTKDTTHNDKALRLTSGTVGTGGSVAFERDLLQGGGVSPLSVVPLKIGKNNCKPGETHRKTPFIHEIPTLYRANLAEDRHQHSRG
jgi:hypothetical protein